MRTDDETDFGHLNLHIGQVVELELPSGERFRTPVIGHSPNCSLLVETPRTGRGFLSVHDRDALAVRFLDGERVYAFRTTVLAVAVQPYHYLHLACPGAVEAVQVRNHGRVPVHLAAEVRRPGGGAVAVTATDISLSGARLLSPAALGDIDTPLVVTAELAFDGFAETVDLPARIRNVDEDPGADYAYHIGVAFETLDKDQRLLLHGYVCAHVIHGDDD